MGSCGALACGAAVSDAVRSIVLLGPPGAGKGTQAAGLARRAGLDHVSTGELLRRAIAGGTPLGLRVAPIMEKGGLVDDGTVAELVGEAMDRPGTRGLLLDGYPRTLGQAAVLADLLASRGLPPPLVIEIRLPDDEVIRRLAGRRTCATCGPRPAGEATCARCGGGLSARPDDAEDVIRARLKVYMAQTAPLTDHYGAQGLLRTVDGMGSPADVEARIREVFERG